MSHTMRKPLPLSRRHVWTDEAEVFERRDRAAPDWSHRVVGWVCAAVLAGMLGAIVAGVL